MALIRCPECGNDYSSTAKSCPKCGYRNTVKPSIKKFAGIILLLIILLVIYYIVRKFALEEFDKLLYSP